MFAPLLDITKVDGCILIGGAPCDTLFMNRPLNTPVFFAVCEVASDCTALIVGTVDVELFSVTLLITTFFGDTKLPADLIVIDDGIVRCTNEGGRSMRGIVLAFIIELEAIFSTRACCCSLSACLDAASCDKDAIADG